MEIRPDKLAMCDCGSLLIKFRAKKNWRAGYSQQKGGVYHPSGWGQKKGVWVHMSHPKPAGFQCTIVADSIADADSLFNWEPPSQPLEEQAE